MPTPKQMIKQKNLCHAYIVDSFTSRFKDEIKHKLQIKEANIDSTTKSA